ncbi:MAG: hypothetical protein HN411_03455 [Waddliaceae bacterium]|jgi:hypothetical protein|nr:hypothetical protein [Waddliaceae bacterium]MBT3578970.1 hypothetical protein [Waddliaceae bacterium]MBT4445097.1 hypothetical protein [Waddliaceae bacterium]MBT6928962.1 hypothetical protein [Waddliaceae bacterium]MBT7264542.1 hypothetical protein [Waddliaceae bacterium]
MFNFDIFLGFPVDASCEERLSAIPSSRRAMFIDSGDDYLSSVEYCGIQYLGKSLGGVVSLDALDDISKNIVSIFASLSGENILPHSLQLFAIPTS